MRSRSFWVGMALVAGSILSAIPQLPLLGCAPAPRPGQWVDIRDESALIAWDAKSGTEHFVRRARFETQAVDFGFMVPTPTQPDLGEVDDRMFESTGMITAPRHVYETEVQTVFGFGDFGIYKYAPTASAPLPNALPKSVEVLEEKQVAGFDATVLRADDTQALADWLEKHGYEMRPALTEWLKWYVDHKWIITAFKLSRDSQSQRSEINAKSIRMSFHTDKPFYPYREPEDMRRPSGQGSRTLRVFVLADQKYQGLLGESDSWPGATAWANSIPQMVSNITTRLNLTDPELAKTTEGLHYLTEFEDDSFPRPGTDEVYFQPAKDTTSRERPPIVHTDIVVQHWPGKPGAYVLAVLIPSLIVVCIAWRWRLRIRSDENSASRMPAS